MTTDTTIGHTQCDKTLQDLREHLLARNMRESVHVTINRLDHESNHRSSVRFRALRDDALELLRGYLMGKGGASVRIFIQGSH